MSDNNCPFCGAEQDSSSSCPQCEKDKCPSCGIGERYREVVYIQGMSPITGGNKDIDRTYFYCDSVRDIILWEEDKPIEFKQSDACQIAALTAKLAAALDAIHHATTDLCACGGRGPGEGCQVCDVWHTYVAAMEKGGYDVRR